MFNIISSSKFFKHQFFHFQKKFCMHLHFLCEHKQRFVLKTCPFKAQSVLGLFIFSCVFSGVNIKNLTSLILAHAMSRPPRPDSVQHPDNTSEEYKLRKSSLCNFLHSQVTFSRLCSNPLHNHLFSDTPKYR
jgi:hypothetical protein